MILVESCRCDAPDCLVKRVLMNLILDGASQSFAVMLAPARRRDSFVFVFNRICSSARAGSRIGHQARLPLLFLCSPKRTNTSHSCKRAYVHVTATKHACRTLRWQKWHIWLSAANEYHLLLLHTRVERVANCTKSFAGKLAEWFAVLVHGIEMLQMHCRHLADAIWS